MNCSRCQTNPVKGSWTLCWPCFSEGMGKPKLPPMTFAMPVKAVVDVEPELPPVPDPPAVGLVPLYAVDTRAAVVAPAPVPSPPRPVAVRVPDVTPKAVPVPCAARVVAKPAGREVKPGRERKGFRVPVKAEGPIPPGKCQHCGVGKPGRSRGLCRTCYGAPLVREQYTCERRKEKPFTVDVSDLVRANLPLVTYVARKIGVWSTGDRDDLESAGMLALAKAARDYRPDRGAKFGTFAHAVVFNAMVNHARQAKREGRRKAAERKYGDGMRAAMFESIRRPGMMSPLNRLIVAEAEGQVCA